MDTRRLHAGLLALILTIGLLAIAFAQSSTSQDAGGPAPTQISAGAQSPQAIPLPPGEPLTTALQQFVAQVQLGAGFVFGLVIVLVILLAVTLADRLG